MKVKVFTVLTLAFALFMMACGKSDADLQKAATDKLTADKVTGVTVAVKDGVATLTGEVADAAVKSKAEAAVKGVEGIKSVDVAKLTVKPAPTPPPPSPDKMIEGTVNEAIKKLGLTGANITATVTNGEIVLTGDVAKADLTKVMQAANEAKGNATKVTNKLTVK
jgi:osmotically-inducible protein OsmY